MKNKMFITLLTLVSFVSQTAFAVSLGEDQVTIGKKGSTANKVLNLGVGSLRYNQSTGQLEFSNDGTNFSGVGSGSGSGSGYNIITTNPDFESSTAAWTNSGGTFSPVSSGSNLLFGKGSVTFQASASGQYFESASYTIPNGLLGKPCQVGIFQQGGDSNLQLQAVDGTGTVVPGSTITLAAQSSTKPVVQTFQCPSSGTIKLRVSSTAASALAAFDRAYVGELSTQQVSQVQLLGGVIITGCSTQLQNSASSYTSLTGAGCTYTPFGLAQATGAQTVSVKFPSVPAGDIKIEGEGYLGNLTASDVSTFQFTDGTNTAREQSNYVGYAGLGGTGVNQSISYSSQQSNVTLELKGKSPAGGSAMVNTSYGPFVIRVYSIPSQSQTAYRADQTPASWSGYHNNSCSWSNTAAAANTYYELANGVSGCALVERKNRNMGSVIGYGATSGASALPGIVFTPPRAGRWRISANFIAMESSTNAGLFQLLDGSGNQIATAASSTIGNSTRGNVSLQGIYDVAASGSPVTIKIQAGSTASSGLTTIQSLGTLSNTIEWEVEELDAPLAMPFVLNQLTTSNANGSRIETAQVVTFGGAGTITQDGSWLSSSTATRTATGDYTLPILVGMYSQTPQCGCSVNDSSATSCSVVSTSTSSVRVRLWLIQGTPVLYDGSGSGTGFSVWCKTAK